MDVEYITEGKNEKHQNSKFKIQNSKFKSTFVKYKRQNIFLLIPFSRNI